MKFFLLFTLITITGMENDVHDSSASSSQKTRPPRPHLGLTASFYELPAFKNHDHARPNTPNDSRPRTPPVYEEIPQKKKKSCCEIY